VPKSLLHLLDWKDLEKRPKELRTICEAIFSKGKGLRSQLISLVGGFLKLNQREKLLLSRIVEYIHNSSLLHDDFIDHSRIRRNRKTAWLEYSPAQAVLAGDYLLAKTSIYLSEKGNLNLIKRTAEAICELAEGEFLQRELIPFCEKDLKKRDRVSELKTGSLFKWCLEATFILKNRFHSKLAKILNRIGFYIGLLFQRSDDLMDFSVRNKDHKPYLSDIQQKYFNSFACLLLEEASLRKQKSLSKVQSISAVYSLFPDFEDKVEKFDHMNSHLIGQTKKEIKKLQPFLKKSEMGLIDLLEHWAFLVYWRKQK